MSPASQSEGRKATYIAGRQSMDGFNQYDSNDYEDDILRHLRFSDPDYPEILTRPTGNPPIGDSLATDLNGIDIYMDGINQCNPSMQQSNKEEDDDHVLCYLQFSDPDYLEILTGSPQIGDSLASDLDDIPMETIKQCYPSVYHSNEDEDDVLPYLQFSDPGYPEILPRPLGPPRIGEALAANLDGIPDLSWIWELNGGSTVLVDPGSGDTESAKLEQVMIRVEPGQLDCSGCHVLREVAYCNGFQNTMLAIHGDLGTFYHAVICIEFIVAQGSQPTSEQYVIDFSGKSDVWVKNFLNDYHLSNTQKGHVILHDELSSFFDAPSAETVDMVTVNSGEGASSQSAEQEIGSSQIRTVEVYDCSINGNLLKPNRVGSHQKKPQKHSIAEQRKRAKNMKMRDIEVYFHLKIEEAAKKLELCSTTLKKVCRQNGVERWPQRKVNSLGKKTDKFEKGTA